MLDLDNISVCKECAMVCTELLKSKSGKVRQTDCRAEILLEMCVELH